MHWWTSCTQGRQSASQRLTTVDGKASSASQRGGFAFVLAHARHPCIHLLLSHAARFTVRFARVGRCGQVRADFGRAFPPPVVDLTRALTPLISETGLEFFWGKGGADGETAGWRPEGRPLAPEGRQRGARPHVRLKELPELVIVAGQAAQTRGGRRGARVLCDMFWALAAGETPPDGVNDSSAWWADALRPLFLRSTDVELVAAVCARCAKRPLQEGAAAIQRGFVPRRQLSDTVADLDTMARVAAWKAEPRDHPCLVFLDLKAAFPSLGHDYL